LLLFAVELNEHLPGSDTVSTIRQDATHATVRLGRNGDLIDRSQRAYDVNRPANGIPPHNLDLDRLGRGLAPASLGAFGPGTPRSCEGQERGEGKPMAQFPANDGHESSEYTIRRMRVFMGLFTRFDNRARPRKD
jgi:hypothetical protein